MDDAGIYLCVVAYIAGVVCADSKSTRADMRKANCILLSFWSDAFEWCINLWSKRLPPHWLSVDHNDISVLHMCMSLMGGELTRGLDCAQTEES